MNIVSPRFRISLGAIGFIWSMAMATLGFMHYVDVDAGVFASMVGFSSGLLTVGIFGRATHYNDRRKNDLLDKDGDRGIST